MLTWREVYNEEIDRQVRMLRDAAARRQTWLVDDGRVYDPTRMSEAQRQRFAVRVAERTTNYAINHELEMARKANRPADLN